MKMPIPMMPAFMRRGSGPVTGITGVAVGVSFDGSISVGVIVSAGVAVAVGVSVGVGVGLPQ